MSIPISTIFTIFYSRITIRKLRRLSATSPETAKTLKELNIRGVEEAFTLPRLLKAGKVKEIIDENGEKRYYLP
jgi:hypothetical protein